MTDDSILVLPIGGQATRIGGIPKFILPVSDQETLIGRHVNAARIAGIGRIYILCRPMHSELIRNYFRGFNDDIYVIELEQETLTMNETLVAGMHGITFSSAIIGLSDTYWSANGLIDAYSKLNQRENKNDISLAVFRIREDQIGKLGQVNFDVDYKLIDMSDKDPECRYEFAWGAMKIQESTFNEIDIHQPHVGFTVRERFESGVEVNCIEIVCEYFDCGTFKEYSSLIGNLHE